jgi:hypothetical protein
MEKVQLVALIVSLIILFVIVELVRRGKLRENYSVLWICTSLVIIFFAIFRHLVDWLGKITGIYYGPSAFFLVAFLFLSLIALQFSVVISSLSQRNKNLAQEVALLKLKIEELEKKL